MRVVIFQKLINLIRFNSLFKKIRLNRLRNSNYYLYCKTLYPQLGKNSYIGVPSIGTCITHPNTRIGKYCSIATNVCIGAQFHPKHFLSTHPFQFLKENNVYSDIEIDKICTVNFDCCKPCSIGNDVWIGTQTIINNGVTIGDGAIIGANSTITKDVPPYAIVVGANRLIGYRFSQEIIEELLTLKWWDLDEEYLYDLPFDDIYQCIKKLRNIRGKSF